MKGGCKGQREPEVFFEMHCDQWRPEWFMKWLGRSLSKLILTICVAEYEHILTSQHLVVFIVKKAILLDNHFVDTSKLSLIVSVNCVTPGEYVCHSAMQQWVSIKLDNTEAYLSRRESSRYRAYASVNWRSCGKKTWQLFETEAHLTKYCKLKPGTWCWVYLQTDDTGLWTLLHSKVFKLNLVCA